MMPLVMLHLLISVRRYYRFRINRCAVHDDGILVVVVVVVAAAVAVAAELVVREEHRCQRGTDDADYRLSPTSSIWRERLMRFRLLGWNTSC